MIRILCVGKIKEKALVSLISEYLKRLQPFHKCIIEETEDYPTSDVDSMNQQVIKKESDKLLSRIKADDTVILLDLKGESVSSVDLSKKIDNYFTQSSSSLVFVIGGSLGVSETLRQRANWCWKLSDCTFPHQVVRLLVLEQIYRSFKILSGQTYHK